MIEIYVASYKGISPPVELKGLFGPEGGTLGRGTDNQLVLPDPARHVSRLQARVRFDEGRFLVASVSNANPLFLNDEEIASGSELPLKPGDELRIGLYVLGVRNATTPSQNVDLPVAAHSASQPRGVAGSGTRSPMVGGPLDPLAGLGGSSAGLNPFADLLGPDVAVPTPLEVPTPESLVTPRSDQARFAPSDSPQAPLQASDRADPQVRRGLTASPPSADPFADLLQPNVPSMPSHPVRPRLGDDRAAVKAAASGGIPADFDPFGLPSNTPRNTDDPLSDLAKGSIDLSAVDANAQRSNLLEFDLAEKSDSRDPLRGGTPSLVDSLDAVDPLRLFGGDEQALLNPQSDPWAVGTPMPDKVPEVHAQFTPPRSMPEGRSSPLADVRRSNLSPAQPFPRSPAPTTPASRGAPADMQSQAVDAGRITSASESRLAVPGTLGSSSTDRDSAQPLPTKSVALDAQLRLLLAAFLKGAQVPDMPVRTGLTPALMEAMGTLVYQATAGAMELIAARQITKREIRADVTMIVPQGNNPLKFLPTPEAAIMQMLGPNMPGFTTTAKAMQDVFDDLRAHEVGIIAGMRAALAEVLLRFDPATLEKRLGKGGFLDSLVPASRQAKLWNLFEAQFQEIYREAQDDYHALFGKAFIKAYEEQVNQDQAKRGRS
jgi:FHA domain-containing protein